MIWRNWLPIPQQMSDAVQLRRHAYTNISMQQSLGMIILLGLLAGFIPFIVNWVLAARMDAALPLAEAARASIRLDQALPTFFVGIPGVNSASLIELYPTLAGLPQPFPGWLAGGLDRAGKVVQPPTQLAGDLDCLWRTCDGGQ